MKEKFEIKKAEVCDIPEILKLYDLARQWMRSCGNTTQWDDSYPNGEIIKRDISNGNFYKMLAGGKIEGVFALIKGEDPTYKVIEDGSWHKDLPYATIHRLASSGRCAHVAAACFDFALEKNDYLRIDTHEKNLAMKKAVTDYGFKKCGKIYIEDGSERIAYDYLAFYLEKEDR